MKKITLFCFISLLLISSCKSNDTEITEITENKVITQLSLSQTQAQLAQGDSLSLTLSCTPANLSAPTCVWTSSDPTVAIVDYHGKVKALSRGTTTINIVSVKTQNDGVVLSAQCKLTVTYKGDGSTSNPYLIYTVADLKAIRDSINTKNDVYGNKAYKLMNDLDFSKEGSNWTPIGNTATVTFKGSFDGNGKTIKNIRMGNIFSSGGSASDKQQYAGLFGIIDGAVISNLGVGWTCIFTQAQTTSTENFYIGGIAGYGSGAIYNCCTSGDFTSLSYASSYAGGIIGYGCETTNIRNCHYDSGTISYNNNYFIVPVDYAGGIAGYIIGAISNCYSTGKINYAKKYMGGIAGYSIGSIVNCYCSNGMNREWMSQCVSGGIAGYQTGTIINCYSTGAVKGGYSGGIVGEGGYITNCYATGDITGSKYICGIAAAATNVSYCIALNSSVTGIYSEANTARVCYSLITATNATNNYASTNMTITNNSEAVTNFSNTTLNGLDLTAQPVDLLNAYVSASPIFNNIGLKKWKVTAGVNNGYPVFE